MLVNFRLALNALASGGFLDFPELPRLSSGGKPRLGCDLAVTYSLPLVDFFRRYQ